MNKPLYAPWIYTEACSQTERASVCLCNLWLVAVCRVAGGEEGNCTIMRCRCLLQFAASLTGFVLTSLLRDNNTYHIAQVVVPQMSIGTQHPSYAIYPTFDANSTHWTQLYFRQTMNNSKRAKISDICLTGRQSRHSALTDAQKIV